MRSDSAVAPAAGSHALAASGQSQRYKRDRAMTLDENKIDRAVLALLYLGLHDGARAWKGFDWDAMNRLHEKGFISDPRGRAKSVVFTEEGLAEARKLLEELLSAEK